MPDETKLLNVDTPRELLARPPDTYPAAAHRLAPFYLSAPRALAEAREPEWLVDGMIAKGNVIVLAGSAKKAGKSWLALQLARSVATGQSFLGRRTRQGHVLYANVEDGIARIGWRMKCLGFKAEEDTPVFVVHDRRGLLPLYEALPCLVNNVGYKLVIIDPLVKLERAHGINDENDNLQIDQLIDYYQTLADALGVCIVLIHHFGKSTERMRGASSLEGACSGWWNLSQTKEDTRYLEGTLRDGKDFEIGIRYDFTTRSDGSKSMVLTPIAAETARPKATRGKSPRGRDGSNGAREPDERRARRSTQELYNEIITIVRGRNGAPILKRDLAQLVGGNATRVLKVIDTAAADGSILLTEAGYVPIPT